MTSKHVEIFNGSPRCEILDPANMHNSAYEGLPKQPLI